MGRSRDAAGDISRTNYFLGSWIELVDTLSGFFSHIFFLFKKALLAILFCPHTHAHALGI